MGEQGDAHLYDMHVLALSGTVLLVCVWAGNKVMNPNIED